MPFYIAIIEPDTDICLIDIHVQELDNLFLSTVHLQHTTETREISQLDTFQFSSFIWLHCCIVVFDCVLDLFTIFLTGGENFSSCNEVTMLCLFTDSFITQFIVSANVILM